ncbi:MAG TPA: polysaccharide biosynthesis protein, partial [Rhodospirillaceae bacterium]|nr:polysaccharide biosynthesis protein [Rhodospirillaceae bacterium]
MAGLSFLLSLWLRLGENIWVGWDSRRLTFATLLFTFVAAVIFLSSRMYRGIWRYASTRDLMAIVRAVSLTILVFLAVLFLLTRLDDVPRSALLINWFALLALLGGPRFLYRIIKDRRLNQVVEGEGNRRIPVLLVGTGDAADLFLRACFRGTAPYRAVGILSETATRVGRGIHGIEVLG